MFSGLRPDWEHPRPWSESWDEQMADTCSARDVEGAQTLKPACGVTVASCLARSWPRSCSWAGSLTLPSQLSGSARRLELRPRAEQCVPGHCIRIATPWGGKGTAQPSALSTPSLRSGCSGHLLTGPLSPTAAEPCVRLREVSSKLTWIICFHVTQSLTTAPAATCRDLD